MSQSNTLRRGCVTAAVSVTAAALLTVAPTLAAPQDCAYMGYGSGPDTLGLQFDAQEQKLFDAINSYRAANGVAAVAPSDALRRPAMWAALDSIQRGGAPKDHVDTRGHDIPTRAKFCSDYAGRIAEITFQREGGTYEDSVQPAIDFWKNSPVHNRIMLDPANTTAAVGLSYLGHNAEKMYIYTVVFGDH